MQKSTRSSLIVVILLANIALTQGRWEWFTNPNWTTHILSCDVPDWGQCTFFCTDSGGLMVYTPEHTWTHYSYNEGLSGHRIRDVCIQDGTVYATVWGGGLLRFTPPIAGQEMGSFEFASDHKTQWYGDMLAYNGSLFIASWGGIREYLPQTQTFLDHADVCGSPEFSGMVNCDNALWLVKQMRGVDENETVLISYDGNEWREHPFPPGFDENKPHITGVAAVGTKVCVGTNVEGILLYDCISGDWSTLYSPEVSGKIHALANAIDPNALWAVSREGLVYLDLDDGLYQVQGLPESLYPSEVASLRATAPDTLWLGTNGEGIVWRAEGLWHTYYHDSGFPFKAVTEVENVDDAVWCSGAGAQNPGIATFRDNQWLHYTPENSNLLSGIITDLWSDGLDVIAASGEGVCMFNRADQDWDVYTMENVPVFGSNSFACAAVDPNRLYAGSESAIYLMDRGNRQWIEVIDFNDQAVTDLSSYEGFPLVAATEDANGTVRVYAVFLNDDGSLAPEAPPVHGGQRRPSTVNPRLLIEHDSVGLWHINLHDDCIWFAMDGSGFWTWDGQDVVGPIVPPVLRWQNKTRNFALDCQGRYWVGNYEGLYRQISPDSLEAGQWECAAPAENISQALVNVHDVASGSDWVSIGSLGDGLWMYINDCGQ